MNPEGIKENIRYLTAVRNNLWTTFIILTGTIVTFSLSIDSIMKLMILIISIIGEIILIFSINSNSKEIYKLLKQLCNKEV